MTDLADRLGVSHSTLYNYFSSKRELVAALIDESVTVPGRIGRSWQEWLIDAAESLRALVAKTLQPDGQVRATAGAIPLVESIAAALLEAGFTPDQALDAHLHIEACCIGV